MKPPTDLRDVRHGPIAAVVIGASAGGLEALTVLVEGLPAGFRLPLIVVQHLPARGSSRLVEIFRHKTGLRVREAEDKESIQPGTLYFAPPDYHLLIEQDFTFALSQDEPVRFSRPSIDVLFESAADAWGEAVAGILLTGASDDGTNGLACIQLSGGLCIVQDPAEALIDTMPLSALRRLVPDWVLPMRGIGQLLRTLERAHT